MGAISQEPKRRRWPRPTLQVIVVILLVELSLAYLALGVYRTLTGPGYLNQAGNPIGGDFVQYYAVSVMALDGEPAATYDLDRLHVVEEETVGADALQWPWFYPPTFMLVVLPLALMPYLAALTAWLALGLLPYMVVAYRIAPHVLTPILALLFPAAASVVFSGQNGFLSTALLGGGLVLLERRPLLAGVLFGLLSYKPQLGLLVPVVLLAGGYWRTFAAATATTLVFAAVSLAVFGTGTWLAFVDSMQAARDVVELGQSPWFKMISVLAAARLLHADVAVAWAAQAAVGVAATVAVVWLWRRPASLALRASALIFAIPLVTPYAQFYDLALLALPIAWLAWEARTGEWLSGERFALALLWVAPVAAWLLAQYQGVPTWPLILTAMLALVLRRAARTVPQGATLSTRGALEG